MFKGSNVALITPFKNNELDIDAYIKLIHFQISNGTNGTVLITEPTQLHVEVLE